MNKVLTTLALSMALAGCASTELGRQSAVGIDTVGERRVAALRDGERVAQGTGQQKVICKAIPVTGSRNPRRVCHSRDEWMAMRRNGEETVRTTHRDGTRQVTPTATWVSNGEKSGSGISPGN